MSDARTAGVAVPVIYDVNLVDNKIVMEFIEGPTAKEVLDQGGPRAKEVASEIGRIAGRLHRAGIVHGDLTTSNMIVRDDRIVMIDFSLGGKGSTAEERGVDLHLLREALTSAHKNATVYYREVLVGYRETLGAAAKDSTHMSAETRREATSGASIMCKRRPSTRRSCRPSSPRSPRPPIRAARPRCRGR